MKKTTVIMVSCITVLSLMFVSCDTKDNDKNETQADGITEMTEYATIDTIAETTAKIEDTSDFNSDDGQSWPDVIPSDIPVLKGVSIDGYYPTSIGENEYQINFSVSENDEQVILDYIALLTEKGYTQKYKTDNKFGFDYYSNNDNYSIFINVVYGNSSKIGITIN